ncbi:Uncharacterized protein FWK35_00004040 [Aphis craccivora]|uniref:Uncharacterized protein n=1 Tax=Aphis craccivora TaxID=307492 RepID=A0A6G0Z704_APHCR|nr:Uncharacterized protein FWK35_00004040 [Aphis craccivora]
MVSKDEAFGNPRALRRRSPGVHAGYGARITGQGLRIFGRQRTTGHGARGFKRFSESQATVDVATTAITNRKTSAGGSGDYTTPPPMNTSAERKIGQCSVLPYRSKTYPGRLARFGNY